MNRVPPSGVNNVIWFESGPMNLRLRTRTTSATLVMPGSSVSVLIIMLDFSNRTPLPPLLLPVICAACDCGCKSDGDVTAGISSQPPVRNICDSRRASRTSISVSRHHSTIYASRHPRMPTELVSSGGFHCTRTECKSAAATSCKLRGATRGAVKKKQWKGLFLWYYMKTSIVIINLNLLSSPE